MKKKYLIILLVILGWGCSRPLPVDLVDPFIGTDFHGHTYPGATTPFGAVQLSPDTRRGNWDACSGYHYSDSTIFGFSHTHLSGTGAIDLGDILVHPTTAPLLLASEGYIFDPHPFSHAREKASPGYYRVELDGSGILAELTATPRVGVHRYTFPASETAKLVIDLRHTLTDEQIHQAELALTGPAEITGSRVTSGWTPKQHIYFVARFSRPYNKGYFVSAGKIIDNQDIISGENIQAVLEYQTRQGETLEIHVGTSLVSVENARQNLDSEAPVFDFDGYRAKAEGLWNDALRAVTVSGGTAEQQKIFYTALYHSMVVPNVVSDVNGDYRTHNMEVKKAPEGRKIYSTLSLWDTFRAWHPLMTLINRPLTEDIIHSMLEIYRETGELPIWPLASGETGTMIGYHSLSVIADAFLKGIDGFDADYALEAMIASSNSSRKGGRYYVENGFIPSNVHKESVSCLLEYAYDDWCIAQMAQAMGREDIAQEYYRRAESYVNVFDGSTGFFRGKRSDGNFVPAFNPFVAGRDYTEANAWQYRFFVPHDIRGLSYLMGGQEDFLKALDDLFTTDSEIVTDIPDITGLIGQYAHGNEPSHHMAYLYSYAGQPWKTQEMTRKILNEMYSAQPDGISGNEDCGQMSAWYIMTSLGLYPVSPGSGEYVLTAPLFPEATIALHNGKTLQVKANQPEKNAFIKKVLLNGSEIDSNFITHATLMEGGILEFELTGAPVTSRGINPENAPYSLSKEPRVSVPYTVGDLNYFIGSVTCELGCATAGAEIRYTLDGMDPTEESLLYTGSFSLEEDAVISAKAFKSGYKPSAVFRVNATKAVFRKPDRSACTVNGVNFRYYEGEFASVFDMQDLTPVRQGMLEQLSIGGALREDDYGFEFTGYLEVQEEGVYDFYTESDDGSVLIIGDRPVVLNDGSHGAIIATGSIPLGKGFHRFTLLFFEDYEGQKLEWGWKIPGSEKMTRMDDKHLFIK